ncbi:MAG: hypothetical protein ACKVP0_14505 [Pirellulaceae bacterium]
MVKHYVVNGKDRYTIRFELQAGGYYKLFADSHPTDPHGDGVSANHLYSTGEICVSTGNEPRTLDRARAIAMHWCEGWSTYCRTGKFPTGGRRVSV